VGVEGNGEWRRGEEVGGGSSGEWLGVEGWWGGEVMESLFVWVGCEGDVEGGWEGEQGKVW